MGGCTLWVTNKAIYSWLKNFCAQTAQACHFRELTSISVLTDKWGVAAPDWLTDDIVIQQDLQSIPIEADRYDSFMDAMLAHVYGDATLASAITSENVASIITQVAAPEARPRIDRYAIVNECLREKCAIWRQNASEEWVDYVCAGLEKNPQTLWRELTLWALLSQYPERLFEFVVSMQTASSVRKLPINTLKSLPLESGGREQAIAQIDVFFRDISPTVTDLGDFRKVLAAMSGRLRKEYSNCIELLRRLNIKLEENDLLALKKRFSECPALSSVMLDEVDMFMVPEKPVLNKDKGSIEADDWIQFADKYSRYRRWQIRTGSVDTDLEKLAVGFSDWYIQNYEAIGQMSSRSLVHTLSDYASVQEKNRLCLILLVDCLPLAFTTLLDRALSNAGFQKHRSDYRFAPLPSDTATSKPKLLAGSWTTTDTDYRKILKQRAKEEWNDRAIFYCSALKDVQEFDPSLDCATVVLNWLLCDEILHSDIEAQGTSYEEELSRCFARLADTARALFDRAECREDDFSIIVMTDHGATSILSEERQSFDSKMVKKLFPEEKHRFGIVDTTEADSIPENLWALGYRFIDPFGEDNSTYFIPKGHSTVGGRSSAGFVHGGATLEEVIVQTSVFSPAPVSWDLPSTRFLNLRQDSSTGKAVFYVQRVMPLTIEIQNSNRELIQIQRVDILTPSAEIKDANLCSVPPGGSAQINLQCYFQRSAESVDELILQITYELAGQQQVCELKVASEFRTVSKGGFSLKDL
ncbi:hypothetical protein ACFLS1_01710 [Verrucomicrobiota bacterium]